MNPPTTKNPSYPPFSLKHISPNPRVRLALAAGLGVLAVAEGYMWIRYWPGKEKKEGSANTPGAAAGQGGGRGE